MSMFKFNYINALYRKNNYGQPCVWFAEKLDSTHYKIYHGIIGRKIIENVIIPGFDIDKEIKSKFNSKQKEGYKYLFELKDNDTLPVEESLYSFLDAYLINDRTTLDGSLLPMLAKTFDNNNNKLFKKVSGYYGQWKINGLRCFVSAYKTEGLFSEIGLKFKSREGTYWNSLKTLESYLLYKIPEHFLERMIDENIILDGEVYLPGYSVNEINHFVKDANSPQNKLLQFWCYDLAIEDTLQVERRKFISDIHKATIFNNKEEHLNNKERLIILPIQFITTEGQAIYYRDKYIDCGFEGLIMRNPNEEYQYGKRNSAMIKFKKATDGKFKIVEIKPEGLKRPDIPLFVCKNDINNELFECHVGGSLEYQKLILKEKDKYIGRLMYVEYGERSGVNQLPFHVKTTYIMKND